LLLDMSLLYEDIWIFLVIGCHYMPPAPRRHSRATLDAKVRVERERRAQLERIRHRAQVIEHIADTAERTQELTEPTQAQLDDWWPEPEVWNTPSKGTVTDKPERRYRGSRANEDKASIVRRAVRSVLSGLSQDASVVQLARTTRMKLVLPAGIPRPSERTLRRLIAQVLEER
jgi:hypothetical protein